MSVRGNLLGTTALASFGAVWLVATSYAAALPTKAPPLLVPAVGSDPAASGVNFKVDGFGGWQDAAGRIRERNRSGLRGGGDASLTTPLGQRFGLQVDGTAGSWAGQDFWGADGHAFWRDPSVGMLGLIG